MRRLLFLLVGLVVLGLPAGASAAGCANEALREAQSSTFLPECRAFELVSPPEKLGANVMANQEQTRSATDGSAVQYSSTGAFADAHGTSLSIDYIARREAEGWVTHAITPPTDPRFSPILAENQTQPTGDFSADLSTGLIYAFRPLTEAPNVAQVGNLYLRRDLLSPGLGSPLLLSNSASPLPPFTGNIDTHPVIEVVGASEDFHHVVFESPAVLTADAPVNTPTEEQPYAAKLYESEDGTVRFLGILPNGEAAEISHAGHARSFGNSVSGYTRHMVSRDGSRMFFTDSTGPGNVYMRVNHSTTVQLNVPENGETASQPSAVLQDATPDGLHVFFTSPQMLTSDSSEAPDADKLYRYDVNASAGHHLTFIAKDQELADGYAGVREVLGTSEDGSYVYFEADSDNKMVSGQAESPNDGPFGPIYVWHDGAIHFVGLPGAVESREVGEGASTYEFWGTDDRVTPNGVLVYNTVSPQTSYDTACSGETCHCVGEKCAVGCSLAHCQEIYVYDPAQGVTLCASCNPSGASPVSDASSVEYAYRSGGFAFNQHVSNIVTEDGSRVFFDTGDALVPQDTNGQEDVYEYNVKSHEVRLLSSGRSGGSSYFTEATPNGSDVFFVTTQRLVGQDFDSEADLYDARVGGGIASQDQDAPAGCAGEACQGSLNGAPVFGSPSSLALAGAGNLAAVSTPAVPAVKPKPKAKKVKKKKHGKRRRKGKRARGSGRNVSRRAGR